jgi:hypothetical protein
LVEQVAAVAVLEMEQLITGQQQVVAARRQHRLALMELQALQTLAAAVVVALTTTQVLGRLVGTVVLGL